MKIITVNILIVLFCIPLNAQKLSKTQKIKREALLLENYNTFDRPQKVDKCRNLVNIWFDTLKYNVKMIHNQEGDPYEYRKLDMRIAGLLENKNDRYDQRLLFFDEETGKIRKIIDLEKINPYTKTKTPKFDKNIKFLSESMHHVPKMDDNGNIKQIYKFVSKNFGGRWDFNHLIWSFRKYGLDNRNQVIEEWDTFIVFDLMGNTIMNHEFKGHSFGYCINEDASYFIIHFWVEGWEDRDEFIIYNVKSLKEIYSYKIEGKEKVLNGADFAKHSNNLVNATINFPSQPNPSPEEKIIIDLKNRIEYKYFFSGEQKNEISINWNSKYKSLENLMKYFEFTSRKF